MYPDPISLLQPTVKVLRVLGVCPNSLRSLYIPTINKLYGVLYLILAIISTYNTFISATVFTGFTLLFYYVFQSSIFINILVSLFSAFYHAREVNRFLMVVDSAQKSLSDLNILQSRHPTKRSQIAWMVVLLFIPMFTFISGFILFGLIDTIMHIPLQAVRVGTVIKMRVFLSLVDDKFDLLIWYLDDFNNRWPQFLPRPTDVSFKEFTSVREWRRTKFILESEDTRTLTVEKVRNVNIAHLKLCYAFKIFNSAFSYVLFTSIIASGMCIAFSVGRMSTYFFRELRTSILFITEECLNLVVICHMASRIEEKAQRISSLVHDLLVEENLNHEVGEELESFSNSLLHREVGLTAAGYFPVNLKLIFKMTSLFAPITLFLAQEYRQP